MDQPKTVIQKIQERFKQFTDDVFNEVGEPEALLLVIDWKVGQNDFPPGILINRNKPMNPADLLSSSNQLIKMLQKLLAVYSNALADINNNLAKLKDEYERIQTTTESA